MTCPLQLYVFPLIERIFFFIILAQIQQKLNLIDTRLAEIEKKNEETENRHNLTFVHLQKQISESTELGKYESL